MEMRLETDKLNGLEIHLTEKTRYSRKFYQLEKGYKAILMQMSVIVSRLNEIELRIKLE